MKTVKGILLVISITLVIVGCSRTTQHQETDYKKSNGVPPKPQVQKEPKKYQKLFQIHHRKPRSGLRVH